MKIQLICNGELVPEKRFGFKIQKSSDKEIIADIMGQVDTALELLDSGGTRHKEFISFRSGDLFYQIINDQDTLEKFKRALVRRERTLFKAISITGDVTKLKLYNPPTKPMSLPKYNPKDFEPG